MTSATATTMNEKTRTPGGGARVNVEHHSQDLPMQDHTTATAPREVVLASVDPSEALGRLLGRVFGSRGRDRIKAAGGDAKAEAALAEAMLAELGETWTAELGFQPSAAAAQELLRAVAAEVPEVPAEGKAPAVPLERAAKGLQACCTRHDIVVSDMAVVGLARAVLDLAAPALADKALAWLAALDPDPARRWALLRAKTTGSGFVGASICGRAVADRAKLKAWLIEQMPRGSIYVHANPVHDGFGGGKAEKSDIAEVRALVLDIDPDKGADLSAERERLRPLAGMFAGAGDARPTTVVDSGAGIQIWYRVEPAAGDAAMAAAEQVGGDVCRRLRSDAVANRDRLLRLPYTVNIPNAAKRKRGRDVALAVALTHPEPMTAPPPAVADLAARVLAWAEGAGIAREAAPVPIAGPAGTAEREAEAVRTLLAAWGEITGATCLDDLPEELREKFERAHQGHPGLIRRWAGNADGLADPSRSGLVMAVVGCLKSYGFDFIETARLLWLFEHGDVHDSTKYPTPNSQARAIARAWVRSHEQSAEEAERRERLDDAAREAAERELVAGLAHVPELVREILPTCCDSAAAETAFARNRSIWAGRAGIGVHDLKRLRTAAMKAAERARRAADLVEQAAGRPIIDVGGDFAEAVDQTDRALEGQKPPRLFRLGEAAVEVVERADSTLVDLAPGPATIPATPPVMRLAMSRAAYFVSGEKPAQPPHDIAATLAARGVALRQPQLDGMLPAPVLRSDGTFAASLGYDAGTHVYVTADMEDVAAMVPSEPNRDDAKAALQVLLAPFAEFRFEPADGAAVFAAHVLTLLTRHLCPTAPLFAYSAPTKGSGKSLLAEAPSLIVMGRSPSTLAAVAGREAAEETRKRITALLLASKTDVVLDNIPLGTELGNASLDALLTSAVWSDRILGMSQSVAVPNRITMAATGNNLKVGADTGRRSLFAYLDPRVPDPWNRTFRIPNLRAHLQESRVELLAAALTVLRAHFQHNRPLAGGCLEARTLGSFEHWARVVAAAVEWCGLPNPIGSQDWALSQFDASMEEAAGVEHFLTAAHALIGPGKFTAGELVAAMEPSDDDLTDDTQPERAAAQRALRQAVLDATAGAGGGDMNRRVGHFLARIANQVTPNGWSVRNAGTRQRARCYRIASPGSDAQGADLIE